MQGSSLGLTEWMSVGLRKLVLIVSILVLLGALGPLPRSPCMSASVGMVVANCLNNSNADGVLPILQVSVSYSRARNTNINSPGSAKRR